MLSIMIRLIIFVSGIFARLTISKHLGIIADYNKVFRIQTSIEIQSQQYQILYPIGAGIEIEIGDHVFDFNFTNSNTL